MLSASDGEKEEFDFVNHNKIIEHEKSHNVKQEIASLYISL